MMSLVQQFLNYLLLLQTCEYIVEEPDSLPYLHSLCNPDYCLSRITFSSELDYAYQDKLDIYHQLLDMLNSNSAVFPSTFNFLNCSPNVLMTDIVKFQQACQLFMLPTEKDVKCFYMDYDSGITWFLVIPSSGTMGHQECLHMGVLISPSFSLTFQ